MVRGQASLRPPWNNSRTSAMQQFGWLPLALVLTLSGSPQIGSASNILGLFPHHGFSHFKVFFPVMSGLAERGHNVTVITYIESVDAPATYEELLLVGKKTVNVYGFDELDPPTRTLDALLTEYFEMHEEGQDSCKDFYRSGYVAKILERHRRTPYDLIVTEFFNTDCYMGMAHVLDVPVVGLSSGALMPWYYDRILLPDTPSHVQSQFVGFPEPLNWHQRLLNFIQAKALKLLYRYHTNYHDNKLIAEHLKVEVDVNAEAQKRTALILVNQYYALSGNRPLPTQLIEIGGVHVPETVEPLPEVIETFLQGAPHGVIFISWGSMVRGSSLPPEKLRDILKVLVELPLKVIWKWESDELPITSDYFLFVKWAPQLALLCHPKVTIFWGHAGLLGTTEAVICGKPLLLTPIYADQFLNAYAVTNRQIGVILPYEDLAEVPLWQALEEVSSPGYTLRARALSNVFRHRPMGPRATAVWWIEHVLNHGQTAIDALQTKAVHQNWFVYHSLDSVTILVAPVALVLLLLKRLLQIVRSRRQKKIKSN